MTALFSGFAHTLEEVALALTPLVALIAVLQLWFLRLSRERLMRLVRGLITAFAGLALFLQGVYAGFLPAGEEMGQTLVAVTPPWALVLVGIALGLLATLAEPAVRILNREVDQATGGFIPERTMLLTVAAGVAAAVGAAMARIIWGFPLWYILLPGYCLAFALTGFSRPEFVGIGFDAGAVATGPMTVTFILALAVGAAGAIEGRDPLSEGFGLIALVALAPILTVLVLGVVYARAEARSDAGVGGSSDGS